ncbi:MAG: glycosyltransferase 87 family protein [Anaerolineae bacterium]
MVRRRVWQALCRWSLVWLVALALGELALYMLVRAWGATPRLDAMMAVFSVQFVLYALAIAVSQVRVVEGSPAETPPSAFPSSRLALLVIIGAAVAFRVVMGTAFPSLSSDMFRYVWDGRVQAAGISPYAYPPGAPELTSLRDATVWPLINRKDSVTIYPPGAELAFRAIHQWLGDSIWRVKAVMVVADLGTLLLLLALLQSLGQPLSLIIIYAWHPLAVYEIAGSAHVEGLMLVCLALAFLAARRRWETVVGVALAAATLIKLFPVLLLPALWWRRSWRLPAAFAVTVAVAVYPYRASGLGIITYYPVYLREVFNMSAAAVFGESLRLLGVFDPYRVVQLGLLALVGGLAMWHLLRPAKGEQAYLVRCFTIIAVLTLGSQFLQPWYVLWLLPLLTTLWPWSAHSVAYRVLSVNVWLAWFLFSGTVFLSYHYYIGERYSIPFVAAEYLPLYLLLVLPWLVRLARKR